MRLSAISFAGTARTLVAVGTVSDASMFATMRAAAPRIGLVVTPAFAAAAGFVGVAGFAGAAVGRGAAFAGAGEGVGAGAGVAVCVVTVPAPPSTSAVGD